MFKIGDKVKLVKPHMNALNTGIIGKVICFDGGEHNPIGIEWEEKNDDFFHSCVGKGKQGYCYYVPEDCIELIKEELKLEDLVSGEWYEIKCTDTTYNWLIKYKETIGKKIYTFKSCSLESKPKFFENSWWGNVTSTLEIKLADKSLVKKYFPDEFKENIEVLKLIKDNYYYSWENKHWWIFKVIEEEYHSDPESKRCFAKFISSVYPLTGEYNAGSLCYSSKDRNFRPATQDEIDWLDKCIKAGKFVEKDAPQYSFYVKYTSDFTEDLFDKLVHWCKSNKLKASHITDWYRFDKLQESRYFWIIENSYAVDNNEQDAATEYSIQQVRDLIGYVEPKQDNLVGRYLKALVDSPDGGKIKKGEIGIIKDKTFSSTFIVDFPSQTGYFVIPDSFNNKLLYELIPEGFKPEETSKFIVGKWYKHKDNNSGYLKFLRQEDRDLHYSERIWSDTTCKKQSGYANWNFKDTIEVDLSEIQQYLPDGHPDKFPKVVIPQSISQDFKVGDWVVVQPEKFKGSFYQDAEYYSNELPVKPLQINGFSDNGIKNSDNKFIQFKGYVYVHPIDCFRKATLQEVLDATNPMFKNYPLTPKECFKPSENYLADELPVMVKPKKHSKSVIQVNNQPELVLITNKKKTNKFNLIIN